MGLDIADYVMEVEDQFDLIISESNDPLIRTVGDLNAVIVKTLSSRNMARSTKCVDPVWTEAEVLERLRCITSNKFQVPIKRVKVDTRFAEDLDGW
ncbi:MAG: hypothetical protein WCT04_10900 [Planctomycetota bacterium]